MIAVKRGASISGIRPEIVLALMVFSDIVGEVVITSGTEPADGRVPGSLHHVGLAVDVRLPPASRVSSSWRQRLVESLPDFDLVFYDDHVHIEFQPG